MGLDINKKKFYAPTYPHNFPQEKGLKSLNKKELLTNPQPITTIYLKD
jgi:hypothetical protein